MKSWTILLSTLCLFSCNQQENKFEKYVDPLFGRLCLCHPVGHTVWNPDCRHDLSAFFRRVLVFSLYTRLRQHHNYAAQQ